VLLAALLVSPRGPSAAAPVVLAPVMPGESLSSPVWVTPVPDGSGDMVVVEQQGTVKRFHPAAERAKGIFLDIGDRVSREGWEEGLLSLAFHPRFRDNGTFFVYYSAHGPRRSVISRFRVDGAGKADPATEQVVLTVAQPYSNHNGGLLLFGPDGYLYIGLGDGGSGGDPQGNGQNRATLLGTILRIDVDRPGAGRAYGIPADNPFATATDGSRPEIWAFGLRNPWRFSFDRATGALFAADVGQNRIEEVNRVVRGGNYGWNIMEGRACYGQWRCKQDGLSLPITEYDHGAGQSITGGYVYRGAALPALRGQYLFADFASGMIWSIPADTADFAKPREVLQTDLRISSFGEDEAGELYVVDLRGGVFRLVPAGTD
jgi:glucose/arabinose dehydrogenase